MTDPVQTAPDNSSVPPLEPVSEAVRAAVESGQDVQARVHNIVVRLFSTAEASAASARAAVSGLVQSASDIVKRSAPEDPDSVLRGVIDGVTSGLSSVAQSAKDAIQEASDRGQRFASQDLDRAKRDLYSISDILSDTVKYFTNRVSQEAGSAVRELRTHAENSVAAVTPAIRSSIDAVTRHPIQTAGEAAGTAIRGGQLTAGALLSAMSGLLAGAAEVLDPDRRKKDQSSPENAASPADKQDPAS